MLSSIYAKIASVFLSKIFPSIDNNQISVQSKDSLVSLENLEINPIMLIKAKIPFNIKRGIIKSMKISLGNQNEPLLNRFQISLNDIYIYCTNKNQSFTADIDSQSIVSSIKDIFDHFRSSLSGIGSIFDFSKIKLEAQNFHIIFQSKEESVENSASNSLLCIKVPSISLETLSNESNKNSNQIQRNLRLSSISVSLYSFHDVLSIINNISNINNDEFINFLNTLFNNSDADQLAQQNLFFEDFSIFCQITTDNDSSNVKIEFDTINIKSKLNQLSNIINNKLNENRIINKLWLKTYHLFLKSKKEHYFNINNALSFLKNRNNYWNIISSERDPKKVVDFLKESQINEDTRKSLEFYINEVISKNSNCNDQISTQTNKNYNFSLTIPSINIEFQSLDSSNLILKFDQLNGKYFLSNQTSQGSFSINDFIINGTKVSQSQPFLNAQDDANGQIINLSKCIFVINKEYENDETDKVDYVKMLDIEKQLSEYKMFIQMINLLGQSQMLNYLLLLGFQKKKVVFNGDSCLIQLQYFSKNKKSADNSNSNEAQNTVANQTDLPTFDFSVSINSFQIQFDKFKFEKAFFDFGGFNLNKNQILLPLKFTIKLNQLLNTLNFSSDLIELKMNGPAFKKSIDIFKAIKSVFNIEQNINLCINIKEILIHLSVNIIMKCSNIKTKQKISLNQEDSKIISIFSLSFEEFKMLDCNKLFLSFDSFKMKRNEVFINNLIFILNASALKYILSMLSFSILNEKYKLIISNVSIKLPFSKIIIFALINKMEYDGEGKIMIDSFTAKSSQSQIDDNSMNIDENSFCLIDPLSFVINISYGENNRIITSLQLDQINLRFEPEEIKNFFEVFYFFKNFILTKNVSFESNWHLNLIKFSLVNQDSNANSLKNTIGCIEINSFSCHVSGSENEFALKMDCQSINDSKEERCKFLNCKSPISILFKQVDKNIEASITSSNIDCYLSPEIIMYNIALNSFQSVTISNFKFDIQLNNMNLSLYDNSDDIFETIHVDQMKINSIQKGNLSVLFENIKSSSNAFDLPSFTIQVIDSVITYKMENSCYQINTDSKKLERFTKYFSDINLNLPSFLTVGIDISLNQIKINLVDVQKTISFSKLVLKANTLKKIAMISLEEISYEGILQLNNFLMLIHFHVNDPNSNEKANTINFDQINDELVNFDAKGDVFNPIHYEYIDVLTKINSIEITLNLYIYQLIKRLFNYTVLKLLNRRNNKWLIEEMKLNLISFKRQISFICTNVNIYFSFFDKQFHMTINDANILPGNLLTKKSTDDIFISIEYDFNSKQNEILSILIKESVLNLNINIFFTLYNLFASINNLVPISVTGEKVLISLDYENNTPFQILLDFKIMKNTYLLYNYKQGNENSDENRTAFEIESNLISMNFVERKSLVENLKLSLKIDNNRNISLSISDCTFLLSSFFRELILYFLNHLKKMSFLLDKIIFNNQRLLLLNSVSITTGKIVFIFCKYSFQPSYRITLSPFTTKFITRKEKEVQNEEDNFFDVFSSIDFMNEKVNDWDYLVEPFKLSISPSLYVSEDDAKGGVYHYFKMKVNINQDNENKDLNINLPISIIQNDDIFDEEEREMFDKMFKTNKLYELPDLFIKNNLNTHVSVTISPQGTNFITVPQQLLPIFIEKGPPIFEINAFDKSFKFSLDEIIFPTILSTCLSIVKKGRRIELNSPVQIQSCIDKFVIEMYEKSEGGLLQSATLEPGKLYPLFFNSNKPKECLFVIENNQIKDKKYGIVFISPFSSEGESSSVVSSDNKKYNLKIEVNNDKSGKIVKLVSPVICQNLLPFSVFIRIKNQKSEKDIDCDQLPLCKNETVDLLSVNPEPGSKFYAQLSMNGIDFSPMSKLLIELIPSVESMHSSSSMNVLLDLNSESLLKSQTMMIFDCRIEKEITINVKFEMLSNGQIKMVLFSPFIFANLTDSDLMILNGNEVAHLPIHNWSLFSPKSEGLIFTQKDDKVILSIDGYEKQEIQYNLPGMKNKSTYYQSLFLQQEDEENQDELTATRRKSSAFESLMRLFSQKDEKEKNTLNEKAKENKKDESFMPLRIKMSKHKLSNEIVELIISNLITIQNDTDIPIVFEFMSVLPHCSAKIKNISKIHELSFHFAGSDILKSIPLDVFGNKLNNQDLKGDFKASFLIENDKKIEICALNQEVELLIIFKDSTFPTPLTITNELLDSNGRPTTLKVYHTNPDNMLTVLPFSTSSFYFDDLQNLDTINVVVPLQNEEKTFAISLLNETGPIEVIDGQNNASFFVTVAMNHTKELLKSVIFSSKVKSQNDEKNELNILNFFRFKVDLHVPSIMASIIDLKMNEILLFSLKSFSFSIDNKLDYNTLFMAFINNNNNDKFMFNKHGVRTICTCSIKSLQIDIQSSIIPRVVTPTMFKSPGDKSNEDDQFLTFTFFANSTNKYLNAHLSDSIDIVSDPVSLSFFKTLMNTVKSKFSIGKFDWFEISPFSFHFAYQSTGSGGSDGVMGKRRSSFSIADVLNNNNSKSTTVSIPGMVFGQFDGNFFEEVLKIYMNKLIKPNLAASIPSLQIQIDAADEADSIIDVNMNIKEMMTKKICENLTTSYECINRSSLVSLALLLVDEKVKTPSNMMSIIAGLTSLSKNVKKYRNGYIFYFNNEKDKNVNDRKKSDVENEQKQQVQQWIRMPRCCPRFIIGNYDEEYSRVLILIRNRFRNKERVRMISKCTVTNDVIVLTDSYLVIISPTLEYISNEISILEIQSVAVVESELRIAGKKESEKMMLRLDSEQTSKRFSIFIASQRFALGMFGMSMIDK